jgi:hypothetical protein
VANRVDRNLNRLAKNKEPETGTDSKKPSNLF